MRRIECLKYAGRTLRQRSTFVLCAVLVLSLQWLFSGLSYFYDLYNEMSAPVELQCALTEQALDQVAQIRALSGVRSMVRYAETSLTLSYKGYHAQVQLLGAETEYLMERYGDVIAVPDMSGPMPYVIISQRLPKTMVNDKKETLGEEAVPNLLFESIELGSGQKARICGIIPDDADNDGNAAAADDKTAPVYIYTTLEGYEALTRTQSQDDVEDINESESYCYFLELENGFHLETLLDLLSENGITFLSQNGSENLVGDWNQRMDDGWQALSLFLVSMVCFALLYFDEGRLWMARHQPFVEYLLQYDRSGRTWRRIYRSRMAIYLGAGLVGAALWRLVALMWT